MVLVMEPIDSVSLRLELAVVVGVGLNIVLVTLPPEKELVNETEGLFTEFEADIVGVGL
jgi:hypothetical protein